MLIGNSWKWPLVGKWPTENVWTFAIPIAIGQVHVYVGEYILYLYTYTHTETNTRSATNTKLNWKGRADWLVIACICRNCFSLKCKSIWNSFLFHFERNGYWNDALSIYLDNWKNNNVSIQRRLVNQKINKGKTINWNLWKYKTRWLNKWMCKIAQT